MTLDQIYGVNQSSFRSRRQAARADVSAVPFAPARDLQGEQPPSFLQRKAYLMRISMVGTGYVGLVTGACLSDFGHEVVCIDKDAAKIAALRRAEIPIFEPAKSSPTI
jgi:lactate dehydrogenase-like 2-hydroxyacid dehydrogenase